MSDITHVGVVGSGPMGSGIAEVQHAPRYAATPLLRQMTSAGQLGRKTGRGFSRYGDWALPPAEVAPVIAGGDSAFHRSAAGYAGQQLFPARRRVIVEGLVEMAAMLMLGGRPANRCQMR